MLAPLKQWYCDNCGELINSPEEGYVLWDYSSNIGHSNFKIIHVSKCDNNTKNSSGALTDFLGERGIIFFTSMLSIGSVKINLGESGQPRIKNMDKFVDFMRRLQLPYYEEARKFFNRDSVLEFLSDSNEQYPYFPDTLKKIIQIGEA